MGQIRPVRVEVLGRFTTALIILCREPRGPALGTGPSLPRASHSAENFFIKFNLKIAKMCNIFSTLNKALDMLCIAYKKVVVVKLKFKFL
jgi:hypothetical protein